MADDAPKIEVSTAPLTWNLPTMPPPLVSQFLLQPVPDADGGPAEIVVHLGYVVVPPGDRGPDADSPIPVTTVASFALTRRRAEQFKNFLEEQIEQWDHIAATIRKGDTDES